MGKKLRESLAEEFKGKYDASDRIERYEILKLLNRGAYLYVEDQPDGPDSDVYTWTATVATSPETRGRRVMGCDLKKMQEWHWITYQRMHVRF